MKDMQRCPICEEWFDPANLIGRYEGDTCSKDCEKEHWKMENKKRPKFYFEEIGSKNETHIFEFAEDNARGTISVEIDPGMGMYIYVAPYPLPVAFVDLFYSSPANSEAAKDPLRRGPQLVINGVDVDDPMAYVHYLPEDEAVIALESSVAQDFSYLDQPVFRRYPFKGGERGNG